VRRLIINADDFGITAGVNRAIVAAHQDGVVTSTTLMATGCTFDDAVTRARTVPRLAVGCHLVLVDGEPLLSPTEIPTLVAAKSATCFPCGLSAFAVRAFAGRIDPQEIEAEALAQLRKVQNAGIAVSHFDTHKHTHMFPSVLRPLLKVARARGVPAVRNPFPPMQELPISVLLSRVGLWKRHVQLKLLRRFAADFQLAVKRAGLFTTDGTIGIAATGSLDVKLFCHIIECLPEGTWEFVCHPGYHDADLQAVRTRLKASRTREFEVLTSGVAKEVLMRHGIELISFRDLAPARQPK
jgi:chitin disaccharide deacetylase